MIFDPCECYIVGCNTGGSFLSICIYVYSLLIRSEDFHPYDEVVFEVHCECVIVNSYSIDFCLFILFQHQLSFC